MRPFQSHRLYKHLNRLTHWRCSRFASPKPHWEEQTAGGHSPDQVGYQVIYQARKVSYSPMATQNRRIAAYLPPEIDQKLKAFKIDAGLATKRNPNKNDSQALIAILSQFFGLNQEPAYSSAVQLRQDLSDLEAKVEQLSSALTEKIAHLENDFAAFKQAKADMEETLQSHPKSDAADNLFAIPGQLDLLDFIQSHSKGNSEPIEIGESLLPESVIPSRLLKGLSAEQLAKRFPVSRSTIEVHRKKGREHFRKWSAAQDPDGIPWEYRQRKYYPAVQE